MFIYLGDCVLEKERTDAYFENSWHQGLTIDMDNVIFHFANLARL
jgi:hypothetical protein